MYYLKNAAILFGVLMQIWVLMKVFNSTAATATVK